MNQIWDNSKIRHFFPECSCQSFYTNIVVNRSLSNPTTYHNWCYLCLNNNDIAKCLFVGFIRGYKNFLIQKVYDFCHLCDVMSFTGLNTLVFSETHDMDLIFLPNLSKTWIEKKSYFPVVSFGHSLPDRLTIITHIFPFSAQSASYTYLFKLRHESI